jgi:hypothetical protein
MPASRDDHAIGAIGASRRAKHTRRAIAREIRERGKPDPLAPVVPRCITEGDCKPGIHGHTRELGCLAKSEIRCWCGQPYDHDWPGRAEGEAHPR